MEKTSNTWQVILGIVILVGLGIWIATMPPKEDVVVTTPEDTWDDGVLEDPNIEARQLCYIWNTEAGDSMKLSMDIRGGTNVIGELYWLPAEKDKKTGVFKGTAGPVDPYSMSRTFTGWWETNAEGMTNTEELKITFGEGIANVGFGEMKDRGDGVYVYASPDKLSYEPTLSQTDCGDEAMD